MDTPTVSIDYSAVTSLITQVATSFAPELVAIAGIALGVFALQWGIPQLKKTFKKNAS